MKVCLLTPFFEPWNLGGAENYINVLAKAIAQNHEVVVITTTGPTPRKQNKTNCNPRIIEIPPANISTLYDMIKNDSSIGFLKKSLWHFLDLWNLSSYIKIKNILKTEKPDLVHTNGIQGFSPSVFSVIRNLRIPHIHTIHDLSLISRWSSLFRNGKTISKLSLLDQMYVFYLRRMSSRIDVVMSPSKFAMEFHEKLGYFKNSRKYIIPNGMMLDKNAKPKENYTKEFLIIGRITEFKGPQIVVKAFKRITDEKIKLHIAGEGPYLDTLKLIVGEDKRIIFHGFIQGKVLDEIFNKCSCVIIPSLGYENFPLVINQAMNKGLPVIGSNIGGIPELVNDGYNGFLFEAGNVDSLYSIIERLLCNDAKFYELSRNAIESSKKFPIEAQIQNILDIYLEISSR